MPGSPKSAFGASVVLKNFIMSALRIARRVETWHDETAVSLIKLIAYMRGALRATRFLYFLNFTTKPMSLGNFLA